MFNFFRWINVRINDIINRILLVIIRRRKLDSLDIVANILERNIKGTIETDRKILYLNFVSSVVRLLAFEYYRSNKSIDIPIIIEKEIEICKKTLGDVERIYKKL